MADGKTTKKPKTQVNPLIGNQATPTILDDTTKIDIDVNKILPDNIIEAGLNGGLNIAALENFTSISNNRDQIYQLIDTMCKDSTVASIVRTYAEDVCEVADNGHIVWCESQDPKVSKFVNYLLNVMNVDKNIFKWVFCLIKYGDVYLRLYRESDYEDELFKKDNISSAYSARNVLNEDYKEKLEETVNLNIHAANDPYSYYVEMVADPCTLFELTKYGKTYGYIETPNTNDGFDYSETVGGSSNIVVGSYKMKSNDVNVYQADDFVHACLEDNTTRYPEKIEIFTTDNDYNNNNNAHTYDVRRGKSMLYDSYKIWREKSLLENAALLNRITRSSLIRKVGVEVGDMPKEQVQQTLRRVKDLMEQKTAVAAGNNMSEYTNPGPIENCIYFATHNGQGNITVDSVGGDVNVKDLADLDWWNNKFYSSYGIPKQYFGWTDDAAGFNGGSSLTIISSVYAKGVKRVQNAMLQAITDAINLFLINKGLKAYLNNFVLKMKVPLTQEEKDYRTDLADRINAISNMQALFSDVEDKARRLAILKELINTLNYGDGITAELQKEIEAAEEAKKAEAEAKKAEAEAANAGATPPAAPTAKEEEPAEEESTEEIDLGLSSIAPTEESFTKVDGTTPLTEGPDILDEDNLPTPEEADSKRDFTENL